MQVEIINQVKIIHSHETIAYYTKIYDFVNYKNIHFIHIQNTYQKQNINRLYVSTGLLVCILDTSSILLCKQL